MAANLTTTYASQILDLLGFSKFKGGMPPPPPIKISLLGVVEMRPFLRSLKLHVCLLVSVHGGGGGVPPMIPMTSRICSQILLLTNCC